ncbi:MAG: hypothetical protein A2Y17_04890 [Clostridiales bacterium GWF2_38_85]|nr:MAG: hypothetical protein A2Y17_04890 [Clostridiales bacterium GWF2_38_85]HBL84376.1 hypothetical protein [Clostridiales bacterium]
MSEPARKPNQNPESYSPKDKPEIINLLEQRTSKVVIDGNITYIDGVTPLGENISWRNCTYSDCMTLLLHTLGVKTTYEQVIGLSGSCYRASMIYGWDPGSSILDIIDAHLGLGTRGNANRFYGIDSYSIDNKDASEKQVVKSINAGIPVLILGGKLLPEWSILLGYEATAEGMKYFGRTYFDCIASENNEMFFTENHYVLLDRYPNNAEWNIFFDKPCKPTHALDALKISLETCRKMFVPHDKFGYGAYEQMITGFKNNEYNSDFRGDGNGVINNIIFNLIDARRAAYIYLNASAGLLMGENKIKLLAVSAIYKDMFDTLQSVIPYEKLCHNFDQSTMTEETREKFINALRKCKEFEYKAQEIVKEILENWEEF